MKSFQLMLYNKLLPEVSKAHVFSAYFSTNKGSTAETKEQG